MFKCADPLQEKQIIIKSMDSVEALDCSPDGQYIAYDLPQQKLISSFKFNGGICTLQFSPCGKVIAAGGYLSKQQKNKFTDVSVQIWNFKKKKYYKLQRHWAWVTSLAFSPNGSRISSIGSDNVLHIWDWKQVRHIRSIQLLSLGSYVRSIDYSPNGSLILSGSRDRLIRISCSITKKLVRSFKRQNSAVQIVKYSKQGYIVSAGNQQEIYLWDPNSGSLMLELVGHLENINSIGISKDSRLIVSGSEDQSVRLWNSKTGQEVGIMRSHKNAIRCVRFSTCSNFVLSGSDDKTLRITPLSMIFKGSA